ncbi:MAG: protein kinase, partial [Planctomycetes bacterium]|nr:protein kinase [Planctomycetota bacterium]
MSNATKLTAIAQRRIDQVCDRFEQAWKAGQRPEVEEYLGDSVEPERTVLLRELLFVERAYRCARDETILPDEYQRRFPNHVQALQDIFAETPSKQSNGERPGSATPDGFTESTVDSDVEKADNGAVDEPLPQRIGPYVIERQLGRGAFGRVLLGRDEAMQTAVAIKAPSRDLLRSSRAREKFLHEVRHVANLRHDAIVRALGFGGEADKDCYIAYEFIEGESLADRLRRGRPAWQETVQLIARVADALHHAHLQGIVHRDIKPANILLDRQGRPYVADFGLAAREEDLQAERGRLTGTRAYMAPEQVRCEGHRVNNRTDIFSLGVVFYEMLAGQRPFRSESEPELFEQIKFQDPRPPRTIDDSIPRDVEHICLKGLSKRMSERYTTAADMAEELRLTIAQPRTIRPMIVGPTITAVTPLADGQENAVDGPSAGTFRRSQTLTALGSASARSHDSELQVQVIPKGLRSFDATDADFFLELLPGPRDRDGLPESIRFWKRRIEARDPDEAFRVGLIYGPSGCGKSSLVKAGLLPRLAAHVVPIYVEATRETTETRMMRELEKRFPDALHGVGLADGLASLRRGDGLPAGKKALIVLDQFEQWLHARRGEQNTALVQTLRQCDGGRVQCVVMVRDDFWMAATRFMADLEVDLVQGQNCAAADLFNPRHAKKVLTAFGRALGALPEHPTQGSADQVAFLDRAVDGLAEDGKIICVRLALFAEMVKGKAWTPQALQDVGGTEGVGIAFLDETFSAAAANPKHRLHQKAARAVLRALLPEQGTDIKGRMRTYEELLELSG